jgi:hypothetical protein
MIFNDPFIAVAGPLRCGSSCIAGVLHRLGVPMGKEFLPASEQRNPLGFYEDFSLQNLCVTKLLFKQRGDRPRPTFTQRIDLIADWYRHRGIEGVQGAKNTHLSFMVPELYRVFRNLRIVALYRPVHEIIKSIHRYNPRAGAGEFTNSTMVKIGYRDNAIATLGIPVLRITFAEIIASPIDTVKRLVEFCAISPTETQLTDATNFIKPELKHF